MDIGDTCTQNVLFAHCPQGWTPAYNGTLHAMCLYIYWMCVYRYIYTILIT